jgi:hypothetical protein
MGIVTIIEEFNRSGTAPTAAPFAAHQVDAPLSSLHFSDWTSSRELPCPDGYFDTSNNQLDPGPLFDSDDQQILDSHPGQTPINVDVISQILGDEQVVRFNYLGVAFPGSRVPVATLIHQVIQTCRQRFLLTTKARYRFLCNQFLMLALFESCVLFSRFLVALNLQLGKSFCAWESDDVIANRFQQIISSRRVRL